ncbi:MAG: tetratricopeptide repeat protein [Planctomycetota bacterium]
MPRPLLVGGVLALAGIFAVLALRDTSRPLAENTAYVGSSACSDCHADAAAAHAGSDHDLAMDVASDATVLGRFDGREIEHQGVRTKLWRDGTRFMVTTDGKDGAIGDFEVTHVFGVRPLQQYLVSFPDGRKQCLRVAWDTEAQRWFHLYPNERIAADDELHWTGANQNWNWMCADCHSTWLRRNYDSVTDRYGTQWAGIDVGCEACHGPGAAHVEWAGKSSWRRAFESGRGLVVDLGSQTAQLDTCGRCHSRRESLTDGVHAGQPYHDHYRLELLRDGLYEVDGTMRDEVYVLGSFLQSRMAHEGVRCTDCHDGHSQRLLADGNALCVRCHDAGRYDSASHHHHQVGTSGSRCVECHMPERTYMEVDRRREHAFRVPRPDLSVKHGNPNACNDCHRDKDAAWAASAAAAWRGGAKPHESPVTQQSTWAAAFAAHREQSQRAPSLLTALGVDSTQPAIVRATALESLADWPAPDVAVVRVAARDSDPLVRSAAARLARQLPLDQRRDSIEALLVDTTLRVRLAAAEALAESAARGGVLPPALTNALAERDAAFRANAERVESRMGQAILAQDRGDAKEAERLYRSAIACDPRFVPPYLNLAVLLDALGRGEESVPLLETAIRIEPSFGPAHYSLALALAAMPEREREALRALERAVDLMPTHARAHYNLGLLRDRVGDRNGAIQMLQRAVELAPEDVSIARALQSVRNR